MDTAELGRGDAVVAVMEWLTDDPALMEATEDHIYGHELPDDVAADMPRTAIVVQDAGGYDDGLPEVLTRGRFDVRAYGATVDEAKRVAVLAAARMRELRERAVRNDVVLHAPRRAGGYIPLREPPHRWPLVLRSYLVPVDVREVATP